MVDGVVLVAHAGETTLPAMKSAAQRLADVGARVFGVVLNDADLDSKGGGQYYYYYYYRSGYGDDQEPKKIA
jgi:Mrp family chromosome partitioning ATPase